MSNFWWEQTDYKPNEQVNTEVRNHVIYDEDGDNVLLDKLITDIHHLDSCIINNDNLLTINDCGKKHFTLNLYQYNDNKIICNDIHECTVNGGYISSSKSQNHDNKLISLGIVKTDNIEIIDYNNNKDLLINLSSNQNGLFGVSEFIDNNSNNLFLELRILKQHLGKPSLSVLRLWHLGFKETNNNNNNNGEEEEDDDDEIEKIVWQIENIKGIVHFCSNFYKEEIILAHEDRKINNIEFINKNNGMITRSISTNEWSGRVLYSKNGDSFAVTSFGKICIYDSITGNIMNTINSPITNDVYPIVPISFLDNDIIITRINYDRTLILTNLKTNVSIICKNIGGTINDKSLIVDDNEKYLWSYPYGAIEIYDLQQLLNQLHNKNNETNK